jgi:DNA-directed RNA polymerase I subunit RPA1
VLDDAQITTVLLNVKPHNTSGLHFEAKSKVHDRAWRGAANEEGVVQFIDGEYICGILDKSQFGASGYGLVHAVYEVYGPACAGKILSIFSRLFTKYLQHRAFTCRMDDLRLTTEGNAKRDEILDKAKAKGYEAALGYVGLEAELKSSDADDRAEGLDERLEEVLRDDSKMALLDVAVKSEVNPLTTQVINACLPDGLLIPFPYNHMQTMTVSGAKGSQVNVSQISCCLGQQELEGRRVPTMVSGKTLPSFKPFETAPRAGGYVAQRFLTGIRPQEYYFHCMAGREGLIDTAVKTSRSGYLQRCLIKHLEGIRVHYDHTVRNSDGTVVQFLYGEDAIDVTKSSYLYKFDFAIRNRQSLVQRYRPNDIAGRLNETTAPEHTRGILKALRARAKGKAAAALAPPTQSLYHPSTYVGSVSEMYAEAIDSYTRENKFRLLDAKAKRKAEWPPYVPQDDLYDSTDFRSLMYFRFMKSLADPGEAVGLLASQGCVMLAARRMGAD